METVGTNPENATHTAPAAGRKAVIVGVGQVRKNPKFDGPFVPWEPARAMADAIAVAVADAQAHGDAAAQTITSEAGLLACIDPIAWSYVDLCATTAEMAGVPAAVEGATIPPGGNSPGDLMIQIINRMAEGTLSIAVLAGCETLYSRRRAMKDGIELEWTPTSAPRDFFKGQRELTNNLEKRHGMFAPIQCYPLFENALRFAAGRTVAEHQSFLGEFMARNAAVAATNPYAWFPNAWTPAEIADPTADNRWVCFPYPKRMNAIMEVDLAAACIIMSEAEADRRGIPAASRVTVLGAGAAVDAWTPTERVDFHTSPGIAAAASAAFTHAGVSVDDVHLFDFYSCFPSAVELALGALGIAADDPRGVTQTGGLAYAGGPGNSYAMHGLCATVDKLRASFGSPDAPTVGLVSALGMTATKHAYMVVSNDPLRVAAADGLGHKVVLADELKTGPTLVDEVSGEGVVETYTIEFDRNGSATRTFIVVRFDDGTRTVANGSCSAEEVSALMESEAIGLRVSVVGGVAGEGDANVPNRATLLGLVSIGSAGETVSL
jgi:acetyl-CoA C-acetyltransferase